MLRALLVLVFALTVAAFGWSDVKQYFAKHAHGWVDASADVAGKMTKEGVKKTAEVAGYVVSKLANASVEK